MQGKESREGERGRTGGAGCPVHEHGRGRYFSMNAVNHDRSVTEGVVHAGAQSHA